MTKRSKRTAAQTQLREDWQPSPDDILYAQKRGVPIEIEAEKFMNYHLAHGSLMANWHRAWVTWCLNWFERANKGMPAPPLLAGLEADDPWGARAWAHSLREVDAGTVDGKPVLTVNGFDVVWVACEVCRALGWPQDRRVDLQPLAEWLADDVYPDTILQVVRSGSQPDRPTLRFFERRIRAKQGADLRL